MIRTNGNKICEKDKSNDNHPNLNKIIALNCSKGEKNIKI
jgi:hypothetical protein